MGQGQLDSDGVSLDLLNAIKEIATILADQKDRLRVETLKTEYGVEIILAVACEDVPHIAGHKAHTLRAIQTIANAVGQAANVAVTIKLKGI